MRSSSATPNRTYQYDVAQNNGEIVAYHSYNVKLRSAFQTSHGYFHQDPGTAVQTGDNAVSQAEPEQSSVGSNSSRRGGRGPRKP